MKIDKYIEFINEEIGFNSNTIRQILDLNNSKEFQEHGIIISTSDKGLLNSIKDFIKGDELFEINYKDDVFKNDNRIREISLQDYKGRADISKSIKTDILNSQNSQLEILKKKKQHQRDEQIKLANEIKLREEQESKIRKEEQEKKDKFEKNINTQFIKDEFAGVFDLCSNVDISNIDYVNGHIDISIEFETNPYEESISKRGGEIGHRRTVRFEYYYGRMDSKLNDILSELIEVSDRIKDERNITTYMNYTRSGINIRLDIENLK